MHRTLITHSNASIRKVRTIESGITKLPFDLTFNRMMAESGVFNGKQYIPSGTPIRYELTRYENGSLMVKLSKTVRPNKYEAVVRYSSIDDMMDDGWSLALLMDEDVMS